ncbi:hypothetical protein, partial [Streptomyces lavendulae]|uniref:hypothetical protein n=1 Tax=Streptomyces lavendulae TaxID=1914 RepID=UPI0031EB4756
MIIMPVVNGRSDGTVSPESGTSLFHAWHSEIRLTANAAAACTNAYRIHHLVLEALGAGDINERRRLGILYTARRAPGTPDRKRPGVLHAGQPHTLLIQSLSPPGSQPPDTLAASARLREVRQILRAGDRVELHMTVSPLRFPRDAGVAGGVSDGDRE